MPYNFEATFTQPILNKLDNGVIKGAKDWANTITNSYITTIKAGLPQGTPPTLPAPGLNPTSPPPYPIGASGFSTADSRKKTMYNVVYAYFYAKELTLDKGSIEGLIADVKQLIKKIKARTNQVKTLITITKRISEQLKELPKILAEIVRGIKDEIRARINDLRSLSVSLDEFKITLGPEAFTSIFKQELDMINKIKSFNPLDLRGIRELSLFVSEYGKRTNNVLAATDNTSLMKKYVMDKLFGVARVFLELSKGVTDPTKIIDFVSQLNKDTDRVKNLYKRVQQFDVFVRFIQPKLRKLEQKKKALVDQIRLTLQKKLVDLKKKLNDKIAEYTKKKQTGKAQSLYKKATKIINDIKVKVQKKVKKYRTKIVLLQKGLKISTTILGQAISLIIGLKLEFDSIKKEILEQQKYIRELLNKSQEVTLPTPVQPQINLKIEELSLAQIQAEIRKLTQYFHNLGLGEFASLGALVITQTKCDLQTFKTFFEKKRNTIKQYVVETELLIENVNKLIDTLQELRDGKKRIQQKKLQLPLWVSNRVTSLSSLLHNIVTKVKPKIKKIQAWIRKKIDEIKSFIKTYLKKFLDDVKVYAINLLPLKSDVQDKKDKKAEADAKIRIIKEKVAKVKKLLLLSSYIAKMARGSATLVKNISKGNYKFSENANSIDQMLDGLYLFRMYNQSGPVQASLIEEKQKTKTQFKALLLIEALSYGLVETFKDIKESGFSQEFSNIIKDTKVSVPGAETLKSFKNVIDNPPKTINEFKKVAEIFTLEVLTDVNVATKIVNLEKKYLSKSREVIKSLCDIPNLEGTKFEKQLLRIKRTLDKNQSFIILAITMLLDEIKQFVSFIKRKVQEFITKIKKKLQKIKERVMDDFKKQTKKEKEKKVNVDAVAMSFAFGLGARLFWTGANWIGPTGTNHIALSIAPFKPIKAKTTEGASVMIREIAKSFEKQLQGMQGLLIPPANTGIPPIPFSGYK